MNQRVLIAAVGVALFAPSAAAQCANGAPPPCNTSNATPRRDPPLEDNRWIVLPFTNTARAADLEWVSDASVGLLSMDMSRWKEFRVIDEPRVTDLLLDVPVATRTKLGLTAAIAIAKRAGAGKLVMGKFLRTGTRVTLTAQIYDTRTQQPRTVADTAVNVDALTSAFSRLAAKVVGVAAPPGITLNGLGTQSAEAVRAYRLGTQALNRGRTDSAKMHFTRATALDSTFALAHARLASASASSDTAIVRRSLAAAARFSATLPEREQMVLVLSRPNVERAVRCDYGRRLLARDSTDAEGWLATGLCHATNERLVAGNGGQVRRESSLNTARQAFERVLESQQHREAILHLRYFLVEWNAEGCAVVTSGTCPPASRHWAALVYENDTLAARFEPRDRFDPPWRRREFAAGRRAKETALREFMAGWVASNPKDITAHMHFSRLLSQMGDLAAAEHELGAASEVSELNGDRERLRYYGYKAELEWKLGRPERAATLLDSAVPFWPEYDVAFGQFRRAAESVRDPALRSTAATFRAAYAGVVGPDFAETVRAYAAADTVHRGTILEMGTALGFHTLRTRPVLDTASAFSLFRFQAFLARGDTAHARRALVEYDAWGETGADDFWDAYEMFSAESYLELGDTLTAWARIEPFARRWPQYYILSNAADFWFPESTRMLLPSASVLGRTWLLYADLAMATGHNEEAKRGYRMIIGMWEKGDPPVQPLVKRAKQALAKLGGP